jgi:small subunit ribosomal protein S13
MPRILGVDIPGNKRLEIALRYVYGVGPTRAREVCARAQIDPGTNTNDLTETTIAALAQILQEGFTVEGDLRRQVAQDIRRLVSIGCYRGLRHRRGLPVRGQRTRTNARTRKGAKKTVGAIRDRATRRQARTETK